MSKEQTESIPLGLYEIVDRASLILELFNEQVEDHAAMADEPELKAKAKEASAALMAVYQLAASRFYKLTKDNTSIWQLVRAKHSALDIFAPGDKIYVENIRSWAHCSREEAEAYLEEKAKDGELVKRYGIVCENDHCGRIIYTAANLMFLPGTLKCDVCEVNEEDEFEWEADVLKTQVFYTKMPSQEQNVDMVRVPRSGQLVAQGGSEDEGD